MNEATAALLISSALMLCIFAGLLVWGIRSGQFKNTEDSRYQVFRGDQETPSRQERGPSETTPGKEDNQRAS
jgi:nitrogen fixation-related uncharacterized protein